MIRKLIFFAVLTVICFSAHAQLQFGGGVAYGLEVDQPGLTVKGIYNFSKNSRSITKINFSPSVTVFVPDIVNFDSFGANAESTSWFVTANMDAHFVMELRKVRGARLYPIAGVNLALTTLNIEYNTPGRENDSDSAVEAGFNLGFGGKFEMNKRWYLYTEGKFVMGDASQFVANIGVLHRFK